WRTYLLARRECTPALVPSAPHAQSVLPPTDRELVMAEIAGLGPESELDENRDFRVLIADAPRIPHTLLEIGRQRELAFRAAGEGPGKEFDLALFAPHSQHFILWQKKDAQTAGGSPFANPGEFFAAHGLSGLCTPPLFGIAPTLFEHPGPALERGRSFVRR